ncbi:F420-dependent oxidoreductase [Streptomyces tateyamensis]|uniref:F420-dependent oxidoreductase n=1 Tax=Streptomyces tateyamensis TaxID=565073 RepID=A0A2V4NJS9_9ACTN|nr:LLM class flavin-dependent oxidoreductase [Streptomyces tateyamensis]PYC70181.1 F420-dependent oxidoreductase [Streptomyces tateyamensis]
MQLGISLAPPRWPAAGGAMALRTALRAEQLGLHYLTADDHVLRTDGAGLDPLTLLAAVAGATSRIRLASSVLVLPYRHPLLLANQAATLDVLSGGRFTLGVGTGGDPGEFAALGLDVHERGRRTDQCLAALREHWAADGASAVRPRTEGGPPVWVGGRSDAALRRTLRFGAGWHGSGVDEHDVRQVRARLEVLGEELDRDPAELTLSAVCALVPPGFTPAGPLPPPLRPLADPGARAGQVLDALDRLRGAGLSMVALWLPLDPHQLLDALDWIHSDLLGGLRR